VLWGTVVPFALYGLWCGARELKEFPWSGGWLAVLTLFFWGSALMIPYSWDEQTYQLALPLRYLQYGSFAPVPDNPYSFYPALTSWFFANGIKIGGIMLPRLIVSFLTPVLVICVWHAGKPFGKAAPWLAAAAVMISPLTLALNRSVYVENFITLFTFSGIAAAWGLRREKWFYAPLICGILAGCSIAVKPTGAVGALLTGFIFAAVHLDLKKYALFAFAVITAAGFWYLRTFMLTGNPFYPYSLAPVPGTVEYFHYLLGSHRYGLEGVTGALLNWIFAGFYGRIFDGIVTGIHVVFLAVCAIWFWWQSCKKQPEHRMLLGFAASGVVTAYLMWALCFPQSRFVMPLVPVIVLAGAAALERFPKKNIWFCAALLIFAVTVVWQSWNPLRHYTVSWRILPHIQRSPAGALHNLTGDPGYFKAIEFLASSVPEDANVLLLFERRGLYVPRKYTIAVPGFEPSLTPVPESPEKLFEKLIAFDYIMIGSTSRDVDLQSANIEDCKKVLEQIRELVECGKLQMMPSSGFTILKVVKKEKKK
ncbi:MAG: hypothetical protein IKA87_09680, partial [Lentisphaeria bacterium]|nr:hypothetical protein [Lentisphaeria bacterium]